MFSMSAHQQARLPPPPPPPAASAQQILQGQQQKLLSKEVRYTQLQALQQQQPPQQPLGMGAAQRALGQQQQLTGGYAVFPNQQQMVGTSGAVWQQPAMQPAMQPGMPQGYQQLGHHQLGQAHPHQPQQPQGGQMAGAGWGHVGQGVNTMGGVAGQMGVQQYSGNMQPGLQAGMMQSTGLMQGYTMVPVPQVQPDPYI
jgi:hypothetical protein